MTPDKREKLQIDRFKSRYVVSSNGCWIWIWKKDKDGYGRFHARPITGLAHRFSFYLHNGHLPDGMFVCHSCDNPSCVNPKHLWLGTVVDNNRDAMKKGRKIQPNFGKTHCKRGHEFTAENTYIQNNNKSRSCKACALVSSRDWKRRKRRNQLKVIE